MEEDNRKIIKLEKGNVDMPKIDEEVYKYFHSHSKSWNGEKMIKHAIKEFGFTKSTAQTYYYKWKKEFMNNKITKVEKTDKKQTQDLQKESKKIQSKEEVKVEGLKVLEEKVIKTVKVEGKNGIYTGKTGEGIVLTKDNATISFENIEQLENFTEEYKQVFEMVK